MMPCTLMKLPNGAVAIVKHAAPRPRACSVCGVKTRDVKLCDYILRPAGQVVSELDGMTAHVEAKTCDAALCQSCAVHREPDTDYCPSHAAALGIGGRRLRL